MENSIIRIIIADDHILFRKGLISLLETEVELDVIGEASNGEELVKLYFSTMPAPDILLVDISMPMKSGLDAAHEIIIKDKTARIIFLTMYDDEEYIYHCMKVGGKGLVNKNISKEELSYAIKKVFCGAEYFKNGLNRTNIEKIIQDRELPLKRIHPKEILSFREEQVLNLIGESLTTKEIAKKLNLSKRTIDAYRVKIIKKLNLKSLPELIKYAIFHSLKNGQIP